MPDPEIMEMLEMLYQYMVEHGFQIMELRSDLGGIWEPNDSTLGDFYVDWIACDS